MTPQYLSFMLFGSDWGGSVIAQVLKSDLDSFIELTVVLWNLSVPHFLICKLKIKIIAFTELL